MSEPIQIPVRSDSDILRDEARTLRSELRAANDRIADLAAQLKERNASRVIAPHEEEAIREQARAFAITNDQQNVIAKCLRELYGAEIAAGAHNGHSLSDVVCAYLGELKALKARKLGFVARVLGR